MCLMCNLKVAAHFLSGVNHGLQQLRFDSQPSLVVHGRGFNTEWVRGRDNRKICLVVKDKLTTFTSHKDDKQVSKFEFMAGVGDADGVAGDLKAWLLEQGEGDNLGVGEDVNLQSGLRNVFLTASSNRESDFIQ